MSFLDLLYDQAPRSEFDRVVREAEVGLAAADLADLRRQYDVALRLRELIATRQAREAEMRALYETASDLTAIRDVTAILTAIVRRARQLLNADMTYLSLNDEADGASYMKVTDGALTPEFRQLRLPLGTGLLGLVAQTGEPYFTEDYQSDERFLHRGYIDEAVAGERIRAILGVPLTVEGRVIGALLAVHRVVRPFPPHEVTLLTSFAAHASVALENARLFADLDAAHRTMTEHTAAVESAALAHDRLTDLLVEGGGIEEVAGVLAEVLGGEVAVHAPGGEPLAGARPRGDWAAAVAEAVASGRVVRHDGRYVAVAQAGAEHVATLVLDTRRRARPARATHPRAGRGRHRAGDAVRPDRRRDRGPARRRAARRPARRPARGAPGAARARPPAARLAGPAAGRSRSPPSRGWSGSRPARALSRVAADQGGLAGDHLGRLVLLVPAPTRSPSVASWPTPWPGPAAGPRSG